MFKSLRSKLLSFCLKIILNFLFSSCTWKIKGEKHLSNSGADSRLICCWHSRSLFIARYFKYKKKPSWGISSTHPDSEILARILKSWNINLIRGSSTRGWVRVLRQMIAIFKQPKSIITVTSDGPRGPRKIPKMGSFEVAHKHGAQIIAASGISSQYWTLPTWDKTKIPKPFSIIYIQFSKPLNNKKKPTQKEVCLFINKNQSTLNQSFVKNQ